MAEIPQQDGGARREPEQPARPKKTTVANVRTYRGSMDEAVYVGRPTIYGNPFRLKRGADLDERRRSVSAFAVWWLERERTWIRQRALQELPGKVLLCWCAPLECHAQVIADWVNEQMGVAG